MQNNSEPAQAKPAGSSNVPIWAAILVAVVGLVYSNTLEVPFLHDDLPNIVENQGIRELFPFFGQGERTGLINRPTARFSFALNYAMGGLTLKSYHLLNILIHAAGALALFALVGLTLAMSPAFRGRFREHATPLAFFTALLWAVHPLNTQAVTYLSQRCESMAGLFYILTLYGIALASFGKKPLWGWMVAIPAFFLGLGTKEILATAPVIAAAYLYLFAPRPFRESLKRSAPVFAAFGAGILIFALSHTINEPVGKSFLYHFDLNRWHYFRTQPEVLIHYLKLVFWPSPLVFDYWWPIEKGLGFIPYAAALTAGFFATIYGLFKRHPASFAGVVFYTILAPSSSFISLTTPAAEYRMYLPLAAIFATLGAGAASLALKKGRKTAIALGAAASVAALALAGASFSRNLDYKDAYTIWKDTAEKVPKNPRAYDNLGVIIGNGGDLLGGMAMLKQAIAIDSRYSTAYYNMGKALSMQKRPADAVEYYVAAAKLAPDVWQVWNSLGVAQCRSGYWEDGVKSLKKALALAPGNAEVIQNLKRALKGPTGGQAQTSQEEQEG